MVCRALAALLSCRYTDMRVSGCRKGCAVLNKTVAHCSIRLASFTAVELAFRMARSRTLIASS
jgi:hypothetical protein